MKASILHPDCQNLVIRDENGRIVAKSTLYINRTQGYGVFNNVEIDTQIVSKEDREKIYKKYVKAINDFASRYNELNIDNPLKKINVGMNMNNLNYDIRIHNKKANKILEGINFSKYGGYAGDWQNEQYVVWENKKK